MANKYETHVLPKLLDVAEMVRKGLNEEQIAENIGVAYSTFREYKKKYSALSAVLKKEKEARKKQKIVDVKEIQLTCLIDTNDFNTKVNHARRFLTDGNRVKIMVKFRGRQMSHQEVGHQLLARFTEACSDLGAPEKSAILEGRNMIMFIAPVKQTAGK